MQRLIPGKTKVSVELFKGVMIGDVVVCGIAMAMLILVLISNLAWKLGVCIGVLLVAVLLLVRLDEQPNYIYFLHILTFFAYKRRFGRRFNDKMLVEAGEGRAEDAAFDALFRGKRTEPPQKEDRKAPKEESAETPKERKAREKAREKRRKEEDRILKSKTATDAEKDAIRARRAEESRNAMIRMAELKESGMHRERMENIIAFTGIQDGFIEYLNRSYYGAVLEIDPVEFRFFSEHRRANSIENCLGRILRTIHAGYSANIVKLERPIMYDGYLNREYEKLDALSESYENGVLSEDELKARVEIEYDRINELRSYCNEKKVIAPFYYLCLFESDKRQLKMQVREAEDLLRNGELTVRRLDDKALAVFLKYTNQIDFDEREVEKIRPQELHLWAQPETVDIKVRRVEVNHIITHNFRVVNYPSIVGDAWLAGVMSIPSTKVVVKCRPMDRAKAIRDIDHSLQELRGQWSVTGVDSKRMEIEMHLSTLQDLLTTLQSDSEALLECNIYITAYDIVATRKDLRIPQPPVSELPTVNDMKKNIRRSWQESGFRLNNMEFDQVQAFVGSQVSALDPLAKEGRGISSNSIAACFPWIFAHISDEGGVKLGESDGVPVFINFFRRDSERVNSNMVIVGKSGSGKSYATKSLLANLAAEDSKIFILDPENEYTELAHNLHGQIINVGNAQYGRLNPFHIITALDDDEAGEDGPSGSYATHLQFLEEFFRQIMPDCEKDAMEYLNTMVDRMYMTRSITPLTDLSKLTAADYPTFDDLYDEILQEFQSTDNEYIRTMLRNLMNYVAKFSTGGRNANIWNGPSTVTTDENFTVFNFQSMLANRNTSIANAQMLLVLKYIDNEIIKNRDYNTKYHARRKVVVVIDEAHVFIDAKFPIALDFMFQLAKRIRKYNGMQIVITQNIKDFVGTEELARKSTAIINACQYSFIFALAPNDMQDLVKLYEKAGGINENEQEQIVQAPRGQAFTIMSAVSRSTFQIDTAPGITDMFQERDFVSGYFSGGEGAANWEDFVAPSRAAHERAVRESKTALHRQGGNDGLTEDVPLPINFFDDDEIAGDEAWSGELGGGVRLNILSDDEDAEKPERAAPASVEKELSVRLGGDGAREESVRAVAGAVSGASAETDAMAQIAMALGKLADIAERGGMGTPQQVIARAEETPSAEAAAESVSPAEAGTAQRQEAELDALLEKRLREMEERMLRIQEEKDAEIRALREQNEQLRAASEEKAAAAENEPEAVPTEAHREEPEDSFTAARAATEPEKEAEAPAAYNAAKAEESDENDDDFMNSLSIFAATLVSMSVFDKMRRNGESVRRVSLADLTEEIRMLREKKIGA